MISVGRISASFCTNSERVFARKISMGESSSDLPSMRVSSAASVSLSSSNRTLTVSIYVGVLDGLLEERKEAWQAHDVFKSMHVYVNTPAKSNACRTTAAMVVGQWTRGCVPAG